MNIQEALPNFVKLLEERISLARVSSEEDLRFTFLHFLTTTGSCKHWEIECEAPLPSYQGRHLDALVFGASGRELAMEFKFHREKWSTPPKPKLAGEVFSDLFRLGEVHARFKCACCFVYLSDRTMCDYLKTKKSGCSNLFSLQEGAKLELGASSLNGKSLTFLRSLKTFFNPIEVTVLLKVKIEEMELIVISVEHIPDSVYDLD